MTVSIAGQTNSSFSYSVAARSSVNLSTAGASAGLAAGSVRVTPAGGGAAPIPLVVFTYKPAGITLSEAGVPAAQGSAFRMYVEVLGTPGTPNSVETGFAIANTSAASGNSDPRIGKPGWIRQRSRARGLAGFRSDRGISKRLLSTLAEGLSRSPSCLRNNGWHFGCGHSKPDNENGGFLMTTTPAVDEDGVRSSAEIVFPHIVNGVLGPGWSFFTTEFILFSGGSAQSPGGSLKFYRNDGTGIGADFVYSGSAPSNKMLDRRCDIRT